MVKITYLLDGSKMTSKKQAHQHIKEQMGFPEYYGCNLDALWDCLTEKRPSTIEIKNAEKAGRIVFSSILRVFLDLCEQNPKWELHIRTGE